MAIEGTQASKTEISLDLNKQNKFRGTILKDFKLVKRLDQNSITVAWNALTQE